MNNHATLYRLSVAINQVVNEYKLIKKFNDAYELSDIIFHQLVQDQFGETLNLPRYENDFLDMVRMIENAYADIIK